MKEFSEALKEFVNNKKKSNKAFDKFWEDNDLKKIIVWVHNHWTFKIYNKVLSDEKYQYKKISPELIKQDARILLYSISLKDLDNYSESHFANELAEAVKERVMDELPESIKNKIDRIEKEDEAKRRRKKKDSKIKKEYKPRNYVSEIVSINKQIKNRNKQNADSSTTIEDTIKDEKTLTPTENLEKQEQYNQANLFINKSQKIKQELDKVFDKLEKNKKQKNGINKDFATFIMLCTCLSQPDYIYNDIYDLMNKLCAWSDDREYSKMLYHLCKNNSLDDYNESETKGIKIKPKHRKFIDKFLHYCKKHNIELKHIIRKLFSTSLYAAIIEYLIIENSEENKKQKRINTINKLSIPELITDFNKIRNYLSILFMQDDIKNKSDFVGKSGLSKSSYEKDIHRILSLFHKKNETIFDIKNELKGYKPNELLKIYETHTVLNLVSNLLILDVLSQFKSKQAEQYEKVKLSTIIDELFKNSDYDENDIYNFRKYNLLPRLKELEEYGFVSRNNDKYCLKAKFLTDTQKKSLNFVVPFFCGLYPFSSIGHALANRLNIEDKFEIKPYDISNILEDCIMFDLLNALNKKEKVKLVFKGKEDIFEEILPKELFIEKESNLLKFKDNKKEYYLHDIQGIPDEESKNSSSNKKSKKVKLKKSPIFSEIYSFYYKIFEEVINKYKKDPNYNIFKTINSYGTKNTNIYANIIEELKPKLAKLKYVSIPLTTLELRWLKTIMQDVRFDLFVTDDEKQSLEDLVEGVEPFDLTSFKVYSAKEKKYKSITDFGMPEGIDKDTFRKQIKELNTILFNIEKNSFSDLS